MASPNPVVTLLTASNQVRQITLEILSDVLAISLRKDDVCDGLWRCVYRMMAHCRGHEALTMVSGWCRLESRPDTKLLAVQTYFTVEATNEALHQAEADTVQKCAGSDVLQVYIAVHAIHVENSHRTDEETPTRLCAKQDRLFTHYAHSPHVFQFDMAPRLQQCCYELVLCS